MADENGTTINFDEVAERMQELAEEIGPNIPDSNAALRAIGDIFRAADPVSRANDLATAYANSRIPNGDAVTGYGGLTQQELFNRAITEGGALNSSWLGPVGGNTLNRSLTIEELYAINAAQMRATGHTAAEIEAMWQDIKKAAEGVTNGSIPFVEDDPNTPANNHCFLGDTPIQMWPLDPSIKPRADGSYDEAFVLSKVWEKPISEIKVGDIVVAYDDKGRLGPKRVLRTMENRATHILDFWGTGTTPGHAYHCADGPNKGGHAPIMDILRMDGAIMRADGTMIRAATNCKVGSMGDMMIHASATLQKPDGTWTEPKAGKVRFGTRIILPDGRHMSFMEMAASEGWRVSDDGYMVGHMKGEDGELQEQKFLFPYAHGEELPKPEAYILARSAVTLEEIYAAGEWEQIGTRLPAPAGMVGLNTNHTSTLLQPSKPQPNIPPAFANRPDAPVANAQRAARPAMNRKQRKAMEAKARKAAKMSKRVVN